MIESLTFLIGLLLGVYLGAAWARVSADVPLAEPVLAPVPDPEPAPVDIPDNRPNRYTCVLMDGGTVISVRQSVFLPKTMYRYRGRNTTEVYLYEGEADGRHTFRKVSDGGL